MSQLDSDAQQATETSDRLQVLARRISSLGPKANSVQMALVTAADLLAETPSPPTASETQALFEILAAGVKHKLASLTA